MAIFEHNRFEVWSTGPRPVFHCLQSTEDVWLHEVTRRLTKERQSLDWSCFVEKHFFLKAISADSILVSSISKGFLVLTDFVVEAASSAPEGRDVYSYVGGIFDKPKRGDIRAAYVAP